MKLGNRRGKVEGSAMNPGSGTINYMFHEMPVEDRTLGAIWGNALARGGDKPWMMFNGKTWYSYNDVEKLIQKWEGRLAALGLKSGDFAAVMMPNTPEFVGLYFALGRNGIVQVPINTAHTGQMLEYALADSGCKAVITDISFADRMEGTWNLPELKNVVTVGEGSSATPAGASWTTQRADDLVAPANMPARSTPRASDVAAVLYTSGTTGPAKGVVLPQEYFAYYGWAFGYQFGYTPDDTLMTGLPLFHINAQCASMMPSLLADAKLGLFEKFSATTFWKDIHACNASHFAGMGAMANILLKRDPSEYIPGHRLRICQLVPAPDLIDEFEARFKVPVVYQMHGMTEGFFVLPTHYPERTPGRVGQESPYFETRIVDEEDREVPDGEEGELVVRPLLPNIMAREYLGKPAETLKGMGNLWFHTGDALKRDENGDLWFTGRKKDVIRRRGENISAFEVERDILRHEKVREVAAVAVPSELSEDDLKVCVVADGLTAAELYAYCKEVLPQFMWPRYIEFLDELPKNPSQKILKNELKARGVTPQTWDADSPANKKPKVA